MKVCKIIFILFGLFMHITFSQDKYEKEYRIKYEEVPKSALNFINSINFSNKIKWYKEESLKSYTYEAKTIHKDIKFSVEFDSLGTIEDVEYEIKWEDIHSFAKSNMEFFLDSIYQKKKITKVQIQITGSNETLIEVIKDTKSDLELTLKYEVLLKGKNKERPFQMIEYLFSEKGEMERESKILLKNTDHLVY